MTDITVVVFVTIKTCHGNVVCTKAPTIQCLEKGTAVHRLWYIRSSLLGVKPRKNCFLLILHSCNFHESVARMENRVFELRLTAYFQVMLIKLYQYHVRDSGS